MVITSNPKESRAFSTIVEASDFTGISRYWLSKNLKNNPIFQNRDFLIIKDLISYAR